MGESLLNVFLNRRLMKKTPMSKDDVERAINHFIPHAPLGKRTVAPVLVKWISDIPFMQIKNLSPGDPCPICGAPIVSVKRRVTKTKYGHVEVYLAYHNGYHHKLGERRFYNLSYLTAQEKKPEIR